MDVLEGGSVSNFSILLLAIAWIPRVGVRNRTFEDSHLAWKFAIAKLGLATIRLELHRFRGERQDRRTIAV